MGPAVFLLPPSAPCDTPEKGGYSSFFKKRDCKDLLTVVLKNKLFVVLYFLLHDFGFVLYLLWPFEKV